MVDSKGNYKFDLGVKELSTCGGQSNFQLSIKRDCIGFYVTGSENLWHS